MEIITPRQVRLRKLITKYRNKVLKQYPTAELKINLIGQYYIADKTGRILADDLCIPDNDTVLGAWKNAASALWVKHIIDRNSIKFSDDKIYNTMIKKKKYKEQVEECDDKFNF